jgi:pimeloyl-ACP methyl ester carboxylesterase
MKLLVILLFVGLQASTATNAPVVFFNPMLGTNIYAQLTTLETNCKILDADFKKDYTNTIWIPSAKTMTQSGFSKTEPCWNQYCKLNYSVAEGQFLDNGVNTKVGDMGSTSDLETTMPQFMQALRQRGYELGKDVLGVPYDWRLGASEFAKDEDSRFGPGLYKRAKALIEKAHADSGQKVHLIGYSMGTPVCAAFLQNYVDQAWKDAHVMDFVSVAGVWAGTPMITENQISGLAYLFAAGAASIPQQLRFLLDQIKPAALQGMADNWAGFYFLSPQEVPHGPNPTIVTTQDGTTYTAGQMAELYKAGGIGDGAGEALFNLNSFKKVRYRERAI